MKKIALAHSIFAMIFVSSFAQGSIIEHASQNMLKKAKPQYPISYSKLEKAVNFCGLKRIKDVQNCLTPNYSAIEEYSASQCSY